MKIHPIAMLLPMLPQNEIQIIAKSILEIGLNESIKLDHTGEWIVDGRTRELACQMANVEPRYDRLPENTDIKKYVEAANLHRRHLTDQQKREVASLIAKHNPDLSNREVAKMAHVSYQTVNRIRQSTDQKDERATDTGVSVADKTTGGDGKARPNAGRYTNEEKQEILSVITAHPNATIKELVELTGASDGTIRRYKNELAGVAPKQTKAKSEPAPKPEPQPQPEPTAQPEPTSEPVPAAQAVTEEGDMDELKKPWAWKRTKRPRKTDGQEEVIITYADKGMSPSEIALELNLDDRAIWEVLKEEQIRRDSPNKQIDPTTLSRTANTKLEMAIRQAVSKLEAENRYNVMMASRKYMEETGLTHYREQMTKMYKELQNRKSILTKQEYRSLLRAVSSDHVQSLGPEWVKIHDDAMVILRKLEKITLSEEDSPTGAPPLPKNMSEMMELKAKATAERRAQREASRAARNGSH